VPITIEVDESTGDQPGRDPAAEAVEEQTEAVVEPEPEVEVDAAAQADPAEEPTAQAEPQVATETEAETETATDETEAEASTQSGEEAAVSQIIFEIVPAESEARFLIDEVLRGDPITVVGATDQVAGQFAVNPGDVSEVQVGTIQVNARTLATDNDFRNRAIKNRILLTDDYEFITFSPAEVVGLPETVTVGETYNFQIVGDLTVTDVTRSVTFEVTATATSENRIEGLAKTSILYPDFELFIPDARAVDTVDDEVRLELEFVAEAI